MRTQANTVMVKITDALGSMAAVLVAIAALVGWFLSKSLWPDNDTWMLIVNTATTIVTFVVGFVILYTSKAQSRATQVKLDALLLAFAKLTEDMDGDVPTDRERRLVGLDELPDKEIRAEQHSIHEEDPHE